MEPDELSQDKAGGAVTEPVVRISARRLLLESAVIVGSILLAFAIDAWWDARSHNALVREQHRALEAQIAANRQILGEAADGANSALAKLRRVIDIIGPSPEPVPFDTLAFLIDAGFSATGLREPELGALEVLLTAGSFRLTLDPALHDQLVRYRASARRYSFVVTQYYDTRERSIEALVHVLPVAAISRFTGAHAASDFPVPGTVLRDPLVEGIFGNMAVKTNNVAHWADALRAQSDTLLQLLRRTGS